VTWDRALDIAQIAAAVGSVIAGISAIFVAFIVAGREDRRQRESERRGLQRQFVIELQDAWLDQDARLTGTITTIQAHRSASQRARKATEERIQALKAGLEVEPEARIVEIDAAAEDVNRTGDELATSVLALREFARGIELTESRVVSGEVKRTSFIMRRAVEKIIHSVGNDGNHDYYKIKDRLYGPAFQSFIEAGYRILSDLEGYAVESKAARMERQDASQIASNKSWDEPK